MIFDEPYTYVRKMAHSAGVSMAALCREARIDRTLPAKWRRKECSPTLNSLQRLQRAAEKLRKSNPYAPNLK